jgi:hypothetical protein
MCLMYLQTSFTCGKLSCNDISICDNFSLTIGLFSGQVSRPVVNCFMLIQVIQGHLYSTVNIILLASL